MNLAAFIPAMGVTLQIAVGAWLVSIAIGLVIALLRESGVSVLQHALGGVVTFLRAIPELVMIYIVFFGLAYVGVTLGAVPAAIVALGVVEGAFMSEYFRGAVLTVSPRQRAAATSLGMSNAQVFRHVVLPQAIPFSIPPAVNGFVALLKTATLAVAIGAAELLHAAREQMVLTGDILGISLLVVAIYLFMTIPLTLGATAIEAKVRQRLVA
jgi:His/Glu/Gln/Arg/opine family amino acid ABC transporter permease subunit